MSKVTNITDLPKDSVVNLRNLKIAVITGIAVGAAVAVAYKLKSGSAEVLEFVPVD